MSDYGLNDIDCGAPDFEKAPAEIIRVPFEWAVRLDGEAITDTAYTFADGLTNEDEIEDGSLRQVLLSGGSCGRTYRVTCTVETDGNRTLEWVKRVKVSEG